MPVSKHDSYPVIEFKDAKAFEKWLAKNHAKEKGVWANIAKMSSGIKSITHLEALDIALCYGWIDGLRRGVDDTYFVQKFTPRVAKSKWSEINKKKAAMLIKQGRMKAAGFAAIDVAKKNGEWERGGK
jgi:uncharacterized protein YdeI (YjbR/CyaY-like superfamily)